MSIQDLQRIAREKWVWLAAAGALAYPAVLILGLVMGRAFGSSRAERLQSQLDQATQRAEAAEKKAGESVETMGLMVAAAEQVAEQVKLRDGQISQLRADLQAAQQRTAELEKQLEDTAKRLVVAMLKPAPADVPVPTASTSWREVAQWTGSGGKTTESFDLPDGTGRVRWSTTLTRADSDGLFSVYVCEENNPDVYVEQASKDEPGEDEFHVRGKPGRHFLRVISSGVKWNITVEVQE